MGRDNGRWLFATIAVGITVFAARADAADAKARPSLTALIEALDAKTEMDWNHACVNLAEAVTKKDLPALVKAGADKRPRVRAGVLRCMYRFRGHSVAEPPNVHAFVMRCLRDEDAVVRYHAAGAGFYFGSDNPEIVTALIKALDDTGIGMRTQSTVTGETASTVADAAASSLGQLGPAARPAYAKLSRMAEGHPNAVTRKSAIVALGWARTLDRSQSPLLIAALLRLTRSDQAEWVRIEAMSRLAQGEHKTEWPLFWYFRKIWKEEREKGDRGSLAIQRAIASIYVIYGPRIKVALPDLLPVLKDRHADAKLRHNILTVLHSLGKEGKDASAVLRQIADDDKEDPRTREIASFLIGRINEQR